MKAATELRTTVILEKQAEIEAVSLSTQCMTLLTSLGDGKT